MKAWLFGILGSVITAIIVTILNHTFWEEGPEKPTIEAFQSTLTLPSSTGNEIIKTALAKLIADKKMTAQDGVDLIRNQHYAFYSGVIVQKFVTRRAIFACSHETSG
ncbi:hypothetical protein NMG46_26625 [Mesorhizobium sp. LMG 17147]|uniref:hypothetical protein n=1 Tax=Mesorhizobium sp. LMG 17147 TaxID=2963091 RepID=UPI0020C951F0|nr:hypothetical protein [Mesorhizobium sp. LMG 17147]MCP9233745.1 hypothetical protein [Mesorhizobium sp. LMG 17147]